MKKRLRMQGEREHWITALRYVDDVLLCSRWFCPDRLENFLVRIYGNVVSFDVCNEGATKIQEFNCLKFLDLWLYVSWTNAFFWTCVQKCFVW